MPGLAATMRERLAPIQIMYADDARFGALASFFLRFVFFFPSA